MSRPSLTAVPAQRSSLPLLQIRRRVVLGLLGAASCVGLASGVAWVLQPDPVPVSIPARSEAAISLAQILVQDYVTGHDSSVPAAEGVATDFSRTQPGGLPDAEVTFAGSTQTWLGDVEPRAIVERVTFNVAYAAEEGTRVLAVTVPMQQSGSGWVVGAAPAVAPQHMAAPTKGLDYSELYAAGGTDSDLGALSYGTAVRTQVQRWANAYASEGAGSGELFAVTQDKDSSHSYDGLGGWTAQSVTIKSFTQGTNNAERAKQFGATWLSVRVALVLVPPGANGPNLSTEFDLLLEPEMNPAQPPVTAWGPAGVGPTSALTDFVNNANG